MGYIFDYKDSVAYEKWYKIQCNKLVADHQARLLLNLLKPVPGDSIIDIGCGTGETLSYLISQNGLQLTGIDPSPYMLDFAREKISHKADLYRGFAEDLPFGDNSFNHACIITTLEFTDNPEKAIEEAARVAKDKLFIGALNKYAITGIKRRVAGIFEKTIYNRARFFSLWELKELIKSVLGDVPVSWRTIHLFPPDSGSIIHKLEKSTIIQKIPFGTFVGMVVTLIPRYRVLPLPLKYIKKGEPGIAGGQLTTINEKKTSVLKVKEL